MISNTLSSFLKTLGLSGNEVKVYSATLMVDDISIAELAVKTGIHRVALYPLVASLKKKGLITDLLKNKKQRLQALNPKHIKDLITDQRRAVRKAEIKYEELLPELNLLYKNSSPTPKVRFFEGIDGMRQMNRDIIETLADGGTTYSYSHVDNLEKAFSGYVSEKEGHVDNRVSHGIYNKAIVADSPLIEKLIRERQKRLLDIAVVPPSIFPYVNDITIYKNKFSIISLAQEYVGVIIESKSIYEDQLAIFRLAWEGAKHLGEVYLHEDPTNGQKKPR